MAAAQIRIPAKITFRGPMRSVTGPEISDANENTTRFTAASQPSWNLESPNSSPINGDMPYTTCRSR